MFENQSLTEYHNNICSAIAAEIAKFTPQLYIVKNHKSNLPPKAFGSAVLITVDQRCFLITAAHCVNGINLEHLGIMIENDFCGIGGTLLYYEPNEKVFHPNNIDMAVFELHIDSANVIKEKYKFLDWSKVELNHLSNQFSKYLIFGYPASKTKTHFPTKQIIPEPLVLRTIGIPDKYYIREQVDRTKTFILYVDQKRVGRARDSRIEELPELGGISGCGVWTIFDLSTSKPQYGLAGLITGEGGNRTVLNCSRMDHVANILKLQFNVNIS